MRTAAIVGLPCLCLDVEHDTATHEMLPIDDCPRCDVDPEQGCAYPVREHRWAISDRRAGDKLGPLLRWGAHHIATFEADEAEHRLRTVLPHGLIGEHALTHLRFAGVLNDPDQPPDDHSAWFEHQRAVRAERLALLGRVADAALAASMLGPVNEVISTHAVRSTHIRTKWPHRETDVAFASIEAQDECDLGGRGFQPVPWVHTNVPVRDRAIRWFRPLRGQSDRTDWVIAQHRSPHVDAVDRMVADLVRLLGLDHTCDEPS